MDEDGKLVSYTQKRLQDDPVGDRELSDAETEEVSRFAAALCEELTQGPYAQASAAVEASVYQ